MDALNKLDNGLGAHVKLVMVWAEGPDNKRDIQLWSTVPAAEGVLQDTTIITQGSGTGDFYSWVTMGRGAAIVEAYGESHAPMCLAVGCQFMAESLFDQSERGFGLENRWGGGLEILILIEGRLQKFDRLLIQGLE